MIRGEVDAPRLDEHPPPTPKSTAGCATTSGRVDVVTAGGPRNKDTKKMNRDPHDMFDGDAIDDGSSDASFEPQPLCQARDNTGLGVLWLRQFEKSTFGGFVPATWGNLPFAVELVHALGIGVVVDS